MSVVKEGQEKYYGVIQSFHGHDYLYLYTELQINQQFDYYKLDKDQLPVKKKNRHVMQFHYGQLEEVILPIPAFIFWKAMETYLSFLT